MKASIVFMISLIVCFRGFSQEIDTIYANENYNTALFFPEKIRQGIAGSDNYIFSYSEEQPQHFGLLKAAPGTTSNLLVLTEDGAVYSYVLKYDESKEQHYRFIEPDESVGNDTRIQQRQEEEPKVTSQFHKVAEDSLERRKKYLENVSLFYLKNSPGKIISSKKNGLGFTVEKMVHYKSEVLLVMNIENNSKVDFEPEYIKVYIRKGNRKRNASFQKLLKEPIYKSQFPEIIRRGEKRRFVLVFSKFTLGENEKVEVELREHRGNRSMSLRLSR